MQHDKRRVHRVVIVGSSRERSALEIYCWWTESCSSSHLDLSATTVAAPDGMSLGTFTPAAPFDAAIVDDFCVNYGVTAVTTLDPVNPAFRDVRVVTFMAVKSSD